MQKDGYNLNPLEWLQIGITVQNYDFIYYCTAVEQAADSMMTLTFTYIDWLVSGACFGRVIFDVAPITQPTHVRNRYIQWS